VRGIGVLILFLRAISAMAKAKACFGGSALNELIEIVIAHTPDKVHCGQPCRVVRGCLARGVLDLVEATYRDLFRSQATIGLALPHLLRFTACDAEEDLVR
jgi:hypothetical protein